MSRSHEGEKKETIPQKAILGAEKLEADGNLRDPSRLELGDPN